MAYSGCSERTKCRRIRIRGLDHLNSLEEETASYIDLSTHHDVHVNGNSVDADF